MDPDLIRRAIALDLVSTAAHGAIYATEVCVKLNNDFEDVASGDAWDAGGTVKIRGARMTVLEYSSGVWQSTTTVNTSDTDGCYTWSLSSTRQYELLVASLAEVNGVPVESYDEWDAPTWYSIVYWGPTNRYTPTQARTGATGFDVVPTTDLDAWRTLAVGTFMMHNNNFGLGSTTPIKYANQCCDDEGLDCSSCTYGSSDVGFVFVPRDRKFRIAHETGHRIARIRDGDDKPWAVPDAPVDGCDGFGEGAPGHGMVTKEWESNALKEGFADFLAAWTWNDEETDCVYYLHYDLDLDLDTDIDVDNDGRNIDCDGAPRPGLQTYVTAHDWLLDVIVASDAAGCVGPSDWRASEYDVLRYYWDMYTDENVPVGALMDIHDDTDPRTWPGTYNALAPTDNAMYRLWIWSDDNGYGTEHENQWDNGVDHW